MDNFDYKKYLVENKLTSNSRMLNEDNLEVKNFAKQIYSFLVKNGVTTKLIASIPSAGSQGKQIGDKLTGGSNEGLVWYWDDPKTKQTVIEIHLAGGEKGVLEVEKKILSSFPNLEQYNRNLMKGGGISTAMKYRGTDKEGTVSNLVFRVKEKTTAKGGLAGNTNEVENKLTLNSRLNEEESLIDYANKIAKEHNLILLQQPLGKPELYSMFIKEKGSFGDKNGVMTYQPNSKIVSVLSNDEKIPQAAFIQFKRDRGGNDAGFETKTFNIEGGGPKGYYKNFQITN